MSTLNGVSKRALLVILDGFGISDNELQNAVKAANTPNIDRLFSEYPFTTIEAGGISVGLPRGVIGNSEVGHMNLGAGKPVRQDLVRINESIENKTLGEMEQMKKLVSFAKNHSNRIHLMGLLSDGGVHSHIDHLVSISEILSSHGIEVFYHAFMDGRDTPQDCGGKYLDVLDKVPGLTLASMQGRSIGMDRDRRWEKIEKSYNTLLGKAEITENSPKEWLTKNYEKKIYDEFIDPVLFNKDYAIKEDDGIFFLNFRPDRAIQISLAFNQKEFNEFERPFLPKFFLCMTPYVQEEVDLPILFDKEKIPGTLSEFLSEKGLKQYKIAETEKFAHITFFFNGGKKEPHENEEFKLVPSPREVSSYDQKPEMSAPEVTKLLSEKLADDSVSFYLVNFANGDMVGHTGNFEAAIKAVETLDKSVGQLMKACEKEDVLMLLTADHGNSDRMSYDDGKPHTSHTNAPVPFSAFHRNLKGVKLDKNEGEFALKDVAPTLLYGMGIEKPQNFTGTSVFK